MAFVTCDTLNDTLDWVLKNVYAKNVLAYGAQDGKDITGALQAALDANAGASVLIPSGVFYVSDTIEIPSDTALLGVDKESSTLKILATMPVDKPVFKNKTMSTTPGVYGNKNISIKNIKFDASLANNRGAELIRFYTVKNATVKDCAFYRHKNIVVALAACKNVSVRGNLFEENGATVPSEISTPCVWTDTSILGAPYDINIEHNCFYNNNWSCAYFMPVGGSFSFNTCRDNHESGVFSNSNGKFLRYIGNTIVGQKRSNISASGIETEASSIVISDNILYENESDGISLTDLKDCVVTGNVVFENGKDVARFPTSSGIAVITYSAAAEDAPRNITIAHNRIYDRQVPKTQAYSIVVGGGGHPVDYVQILNNDWLDARLAVFFNGAGLLGPNCRIENNTQ